MRIELNTDFLSEEDLKDLAASYHMFEVLAERDERVDCERVYHVLYTYYLLKYNTDAKVTYQLDPDAASIEDFGSVTVSAKDINITNTAAFKKAAQLASNFEIYPKTNGKVDMSFGFYGLTSGKGGH